MAKVERKPLTLFENICCFITVAALVIFVLSSCESKEDFARKAVRHSDEDVAIAEIDNCQYLVWRTYGGAINYTHKGNCKYCLIRNKK